MAASATEASSSFDAVSAEPSRCWHFSKEQMRKASSYRDGFDEKKELLYRQQAARFIQTMGDRLNYGVKETRLKISQLCMCSAMIHMHRFFYFHSFKMFDFRDLAAACLFLAGKSEECPRKLEHIVKVWWSLKFPKYSSIPQKNYHDAAQLIVTLENVILQTIAFDLKIELPHPLVLGQMHKISRGNKKLTEVAYFFATDVLCVTNWAIRLTAQEIAAVCIYIVCLWANHQIPVEGLEPWYQFADITMDKLEEMAQEFVSIYESCKDLLQLTKFVHKGYIQQPKGSRPVSDLIPGGNLLPPPPMPPTIHKKMDLSEYKNRTTPAGSSSESRLSSTQSTPVTRPSFIPDMNTPLSTNGEDRERHHKHHKEKKEHKHKKEKEHRDKERSKEKDEERERRREERKREHESRGLSNSSTSAHMFPSSEKRPRLDVSGSLPQPSSASRVSGVSVQGPGLPPQAPWRPVPSASKVGGA